MSAYFLLFVFYSFLGWCLEKLFAAAIRSPQRHRKCYLLLPLCPVYGLAMLAVVALIPAEMDFWVRAMLGGLLCTAVEYAVHWFYQKFFSVAFWDYSDLPGALDGRVCPQFAAAWGVLSALAVTRLQPGLMFLAAKTPPLAAYALWLLLVTDSVFTCSVLRRYGRELLTLPALAAYARARSQSATSL